MNYSSPFLTSLPVTGGAAMAIGTPWALYTAVSVVIGAAALRFLFRRQSLRP